MHLSQDTTERLAPIAFAAGVVVAGAAMWRAKPSAFDMPEPAPIHDDHAPGRLARFARGSRDRIARVAPGNLAVAVGRSLVISGAALLIVRLFDELSARR
ncbi:hypothetical protein [Arenibacterium halophilum]|jgi:hypothetical protein|uniref:Uncharacterized protein n=1 Tax=Arenibacterium halophilum TaxID=2583821 RepID=A0ABY2X6B4_9RHOB|nr:hypothetical protein [Arenibacterium halophilum]MAY87749.1 hypothetical protein [Pseudooceanicola sp.]TMV11315.1 hypothetical protein FGK64_13560 [Arenibacterium halophilum]